jgi:outer membrane immunogenic protein
MRRFLLITVSIASLGSVLPAQAADVAPDEAFSWTGVHVGVGGGAGYNLYDVQSDALFEKDFILKESQAMSIDADLGKWYAFGTGEIGADYQFDSSPIVVGFLVSYDLNGDTSANAEAFTEEDDGDFSQSSVEAELDDSLFVGGRLGFVLNDTTLLYGLGGYTWVDGKVKAHHEFDELFFSGESSINEKDSVDGWTLGAGLETMLTEMFSIKLEYRHDFLDDIKWNESDIDDFDSTEASGKVDFSRDTVRAVISLHFNPM